jgi:hypothetical protein
MADKIFLSYRRFDTAGTTGRLHDYLVKEFGEKMVFKDVNDIPAGVDFRKVLGKEILESKIVLVMIGQHYTSVKNNNGERRLFDHNDFVRIEVETAIHMNKIVIPVLVDGAVMPSNNDLPTELQDLVNFNAVVISHDRWKSDVGELMKKIRYHLPDQTKKDSTTHQRSKPHSQSDVPPVAPPVQKRSWLVPALLGVVATFVILMVIGLMMEDEPSISDNNVNPPEEKEITESTKTPQQVAELESTPKKTRKKTTSPAEQEREDEPSTYEDVNDYRAVAAPRTYRDILIGTWDCYQDGAMYNNGQTLYSITFYEDGRIYNSYTGVSSTFFVEGNFITIPGNNIFEIVAIDEKNVQVQYLDASFNVYTATYRKRG